LLQEAKCQELEERVSIAGAKEAVYESELEEQREIVARLTLAGTNFTKAHAEDIRQVEQLETMLHNLQVHANELEQTIAEHKKLSSTQTQEIGKLEKELQEQVAALSLQNRDAAERLQNLALTLAEEQQTSQDLRSGLNVKGQELSNSLAREQDLTAQLKTAEENFATAMREDQHYVEELEMKLADLQMRTNALDEYKKMAIAQIQDFEKRENEYENEMGAAQVRVKEVEAALKGAQKIEGHIHLLEVELSQEKVYAETLHATLQEMMGKLDVEQNHSEKLEGELKDAALQVAEQRLIIEQYALTNGELKSKLSEMEASLNQEKHLREQVVAEMKEAMTGADEETQVRLQLERQLLELT
jgi:chromosome segregation ATPase